MSTSGLDPWETLIEIYWQGHMSPLTVVERRQAKEVIQLCITPFTHTKYQTLMRQRGPLEVFLRMRGDRRRADFIEGVPDKILIQGLIQCLWDKMHTPRFPPLGIYDHFKGGVYLAQGLSKWASGTGETMVRVVEYISIPDSVKYTRLVSQWREVVQWPDGQYRSRFVFRGAPNKNPPVPSFKVTKAST